MNTDDGPNEAGIVVEVSADLEPLIPRFLERRRDEVGALQAAADQGDLEALRSMGHALKGTAGGYGFHHLTDLGAALEQAAREGDLPASVAAVEAIAAHVRRIQVVFV